VLPANSVTLALEKYKPYYDVISEFCSNFMCLFSLNQILRLLRRPFRLCCGNSLHIALSAICSRMHSQGTHARGIGPGSFAPEMEPRHTSRQSPERRRLPPWYGKFVSVCNRHGLCARTHVGRHDQKIRTRLYRALHIMAFAATPARPCRVEMLHPNIDWQRVWSNLHAAWVPDTVQSQWYMAIHDILPTKERLHRIALAHTAHCTHCGHLDTLSHRLIRLRSRKANVALDTRTPGDDAPHSPLSHS
jgi:hypothetical protein